MCLNQTIGSKKKKGSVKFKKKKKSRKCSIYQEKEMSMDDRQTGLHVCRNLSVSRRERNIFLPLNPAPSGSDIPFLKSLFLKGEILEHNSPAQLTRDGYFQGTVSVDFRNSASL